MKAIEVMPGVARTSGQGDPLLRGAAWNESKAHLDGVPVPFLFHFGGLTSFMHPRLIERVDLYPSNFSTRKAPLRRYRRGARTRSAKRRAARLARSQPDRQLAPRRGTHRRATSIAAAARRSNIDFFFETFVPKDAYAVVAAPIYWDYQAMLAHRFDTNHRLRVMVYGGRDSVDLLFSDPVAEDPAIEGKVGGAIGFHRLQTSLRSSLSSTASQELTVALTTIDIEQSFGDLRQAIHGPEVHARGEWSFELFPSLRLTAGTDFYAWFAAGEYPRGGSKT